MRGKKAKALRRLANRLLAQIQKDKQVKGKSLLKNTNTGVVFNNPRSSRGVYQGVKRKYGHIGPKLLNTLKV